jgi:hypothetical protein
MGGTSPPGNRIRIAEIVLQKNRMLQLKIYTNPMQAGNLPRTHTLSLVFSARCGGCVAQKTC